MCPIRRNSLLVHVAYTKYLGLFDLLGSKVDWTREGQRWFYVGSVGGKVTKKERVAVCEEKEGIGWVIFFCMAGIELMGFEVVRILDIVKI